MQRRLAAIVAIDVVGFSRLMEQDEGNTLTRLKALHKELVQPQIKKEQGRIVKLMGDGLLAEFASVVESTQCAINIQTQMAEREQELPEDQRLRLRIGINFGDVIVEGEDIFGDGVNIAARMESLAKPGGICISAKVYEEVKFKLSAVFANGGEQKVKNIQHPICVFQWKQNETRVIAETSSGSPLALPDKPSIAILPFDNMSNDPEQDFFADGISEDIITELSRYRSLFVIARNSSFSFRDQSIDIKEIGKKLGVRYLVEGSVRRAGNRIRITAQLIDAVDDAHLWADKYDRDLEDIFALQDEVVSAIVRTIEPHMLNNERQRALRKPTENLDAWENYQRGMWHAYNYQQEESFKALDCFDRAINMDINFALAYAGKAFATYILVLMGGGDREQRLTQGLAAAKTAIRLDPSDPFAHVSLGRTYTILGQHKNAISACDVSIALNPSFATVHFGRAHSLWHSGYADQALASHDEAMRLSPLDPMFWAYMASKAIALTILKRYDEAIDYSVRAQQHAHATIWAYLAQISSLAWLGRIEEAESVVAKLLQFKDDITIRFLEESLPMTHQESREHFFTGLRRGGISD